MFVLENQISTVYNSPIIYCLKVELNTLCTNIGEIPVLFVLSTGLRPIMLGGRSHLLELWLWRLIFMGRNLCQSLQLQVDIDSPQLLMNIIFFFLILLSNWLILRFQRKGVIEKESGKCVGEKFLSQSPEVTVRKVPVPNCWLLPDSQRSFLVFQRDGGMMHQNQSYSYLLNPGVCSEESSPALTAGNPNGVSVRDF